LKKPIAGLDLIRFFAAFLVMAYHLIFWACAAPYESTAKKLLAGTPVVTGLTSISWFGSVGVDVFFVLSGFVIVYSASGDSWAFARSRVLRLVPGAFVCASVTALILLPVMAPLSILRRWAAAVTFWPFDPWIDGVYWTLGIEVAFYSLIFFLLRYASLERLRLILYPIGIVSSLFWLTGLHLTDPTVARIARLALLYDGNLFALGGLIWLSSKRDWPLMALCIVSAVIHIADAQAWQAVKAESSVVVPIIVWLVCVAGIFASTRLNIAIPYARTVGLATYPLYLLHDNLGPAAMRVGYGLIPSPVFALLFGMLVSCAVAFAVASWAEPPLRAFLRRSEEALREGSRVRAIG
jgi:peptidoglycan/LPS O-acetylase OafA/YrhL